MFQEFSPRYLLHLFRLDCLERTHIAAPRLRFGLRGHETVHGLVEGFVFAVLAG